MWYLPIAFKNIFRDRKRSFSLGISYFFVSILLLAVSSLTNGARKNITGNVVTSTAGHLTISGEYVVNGRTFQGIASYKRIDSLIHRLFPDARILTRYTLSSSVFYNGISKRLSFSGINPSDENSLRNQLNVSDQTWNEFRENPQTVILPESVASYFGMSVKDDILIATRTRYGAFNTGSLRIGGLQSSGNYFLKDFVICHFSFLQSLDLADSNTASKMYIYFEDKKNITDKRDRIMELLSDNGYLTSVPANSSDAINAVSSASPRSQILDSTINRQNLTLATIDEVTGILSSVEGAINGIGIFVAAIMIFVIAVSIFINLRMTINERLQEIGTLRAIGAEQMHVSRLFIAENLFLSLIFSFSGILSGLIFIYLFSKVFTFSPEGNLSLFLDNGHFVLIPAPGTVFLIPVLLGALTALFSWFPARYGSRISPVKALNAIDI